MSWLATHPDTEPEHATISSVDETWFSNTFHEIDLKALNASLNTSHWKEALRQTNRWRLIAKRQWFENRRKGYPFVTLDCPANGRVLDVGAGAGVVADIASTYYREVVALDYNNHLVSFMRQRFQQDRRGNIRLIRANAARLPFRSSTFDLVIVSGVLEWLPSAINYGDPQRIQIEFLKGCARVLKPGGTVAIMIENRFHFNYLLGDTPHHDLPFTTVLPRALANWLSWRIRGKPYRTYIYSAKGLSRLLAAAGFRTRSVSVVLPTYYDPILIIPTEPTALFSELIESSGSLPKGLVRRSVYKLFLRLGVMKYLLHSFLVIGDKHD